MSAWTWRIARRWLLSSRRDAFTSVLSGVAVLGIALGCAALVVALAALSGMQRVVWQQVMSRTPGLVVSIRDSAAAVELAHQIERLPGVRAARTVLRGRGWIRARSGPAVPVEIYGHLGTVPDSFPGAADRPPGLYLPRDLAARLGLEVGEPVELLSARPQLAPFGPVPRKLEARLSGTFEGLETMGGDRAVLPISLAERLLGTNRIRQIEVSLVDLQADVAPAVRRLLPPGAELKTWRELNRGLFWALRLERVVLFAALSLIVFVAVLVLFADLSVIAASKQQEIAVLQSLGALPRDVGASLTLLGLQLAGLGATFGILLGSVLAWLADRYQWIRLTPGLLLFDALPFRVELSELVRIFLLTLLLAGGFSWLASRRSVADEPARGFQS